MICHTPPVIVPVPADGKSRPFWSVMIPAYNPSADYLEQTLRSVLAQDPGPDLMQIEVVDDCSPKVEVAALVRKIAGDRIKVSPTPKNLGLGGCWNTCIERARGEWVHILHQDDLVMPGFYAAMRRGVETDPKIDAAFSRHVWMNPGGHWESISELQRESAGVLEDWAEKIAVKQLIQCAAIVVRRAAYERLGGFLTEFSYVLDWEMWHRIAIQNKFWYEPQILACYRMHPDSATSQLMLDTADIREIQACIDLMSGHYPPEKATVLARKARNCYAPFAVMNARHLLATGQPRPALRQVREALRMSCNGPTIQAVGLFFIFWARLVRVRLKRHF